MSEQGRGWTRATLGLFVVLGLGWTAPAAAQGLTASVAPEYAHARWGESVGLENANLFGGSAALGFGRYVFVRATYAVAPTLRTSLSGSGYGAGAEENSVDLSFLSTDVQLRLGGARIAPVVVGGGGVLGLSPDARDDVRQVAVGFGGGVDARILPWLSGQLLVKNMLFRLDRSTIAGDEMGAGVAPDPEPNDVRRSLTFTASLGARLGGGRESSAADQLDDDMTRALSGGDGLMIPVELQAGVVRFADALAIDNQAMLGLRAGLDFGPYFGIRGSYSRGLESGPISAVGMSTWTGEAQFNVGRITGASPHLLLGFGQMTFWGDFRNDDDLLPDDKDALILGAGFGVPLTDRSRLVVSLRDYVTSPGSVSGVSSTSDLRHNFGLSVGLSYNLRRARPTPGRPPGPIAEAPEAPEADQVADTVAAAPTAAASPEPTQQVAAQDTAAPPTPAPQQQPVAGPAASQAAAAPDSAAQRAGGYQSDRMVSIPLPTQGQLTIRYGPEPTPTPGAPSAEPTAPAPGSQGAAAAPDSSVAAGASSGITQDDLLQLEQRLSQQLQASIAQLQQAGVADSVAAAGPDVAAAAVTPDSLDVVTRADLEAMEARLTEALTATVRNETAAAADSSTVAALVRSELQRALDADTLTAAVRTLPATAPDSLDVVTSADLEAMEARLTEALVATVREQAAAAADSSAAAPGPAQAERADELAELSRQVDELAQLVRQRQGGDAPDVQAPTPVNVTVPTSVSVAGATNQPGGPVFQGVSGRLGPSRIRDSGTGVGGALDVSLFSLWSNRIHPYLGFRASQVPVGGVLGGAPYDGDVTSMGGVAGASVDIASLGPVHSALNVGLVGIGGGTSGDTPAEAGVVDQLYGGFVMGPKVSLDLGWNPETTSRWSVLASIDRRWAGARGGWSFHVGFQWFRGGVARTGRPLFVTGAPPAAPTSQPPLGAAETRPDRAVAPAADSTGADAQPATAPAAADSVAERRLSELQQALEEERERRQQTELAADSLAESVRLAQQRADSLSALAAAADEAERERETAAEERAALRSDLEGLVGVVEVVQAVRETERGLEIVLGGELFASGATTLEGAARAGVNRVAQRLAQADEYDLLVDGHTDATGSAETNLIVSRERASEVRSVLLQAGVSPNRIDLVGSGEESPIASNDNAAGRALNRRVEIVLIDFGSGS